jgi:hypothetical protein
MQMRPSDPNAVLTAAHAASRTGFAAGTPGFSAPAPGGAPALRAFLDLPAPTRR